MLLYPNLVRVSCKDILNKSKILIKLVYILIYLVFKSGCISYGNIRVVNYDSSHFGFYLQKKSFSGNTMDTSNGHSSRLYILMDFAIEIIEADNVTTPSLQVIPLIYSKIHLNRNDKVYIGRQSESS